MLFALSSSLGAATVYNNTLTGTAGGNAVSVRALFDVAGNNLTLTLSNLQGSVNSVGQVITGFSFQYTDLIGSLNYLNSTSSGQEITVNSNGSTTLGPTTTMNWANYSFSNGYILCLLCQGIGDDRAGQKNHGIIGAGPFTASGGSVRGNAPHNPFINQSGTFLFTGVTGINIREVTAYFGTNNGVSITRDLTGGVAETSIPEPSSLALLGSSLIGLLAYVKKNKKC